MSDKITNNPEIELLTAELASARRELQWEASLERVRRVTGEMTEPSDLTEVVKQIKREVDVLYGGNILEVDLMLEADEETLQFWSIVEVQEVPDSMEQFGQFYPKKPEPPHPVIEKMWASEGDFNEFSSDLEEMWKVHASLARYVPHEAELLKAVLDSGSLERMWFTVSSIRGGRMFLAWAVQPPAEMAIVQPRIAAVLGDAQKRVEELREANIRTREAQIEAALERVRSKAMGMRNSDELLEVVATIHQQFSGLGLECGVFWHARYFPDYYEKALTSIDGSKVLTLMILPRDFSAVPELAAWERGNEKIGVFAFDAEQGGQYMEHMIAKGRFLEVDPHSVTPEYVRENGGLTFVQARTTKGEIEMLFAFSGEEALQKLHEHGKTDVVLVLSDINMPGMTGLELLERIKSDPPPLPVCMMTAYDNDDYRGKAAALQCDGYVSKPIDFAALKEKINSFIV